MLDRHRLVALGVQQQQALAEVVRGDLEVDVRQHERERRRGRRGTRSAPPAAPRSSPPDVAGQIATTARRADPLGRGQREPAAHRRAAQRDRALRQHGGDRRDVVERAGTERALAVAVAAHVEADRRDPVRAELAGEVEVALLRRVGAVDDHDAARRPSSGVNSA